MSDDIELLESATKPIEEKETLFPRDDSARVVDVRANYLKKFIDRDKEVFRYQLFASAALNMILGTAVCILASAIAWNGDHGILATGATCVGAGHRLLLSHIAPTFIVR